LKISFLKILLSLWEGRVTMRSPHDSPVVARDGEAQREKRLWGLLMEWREGWKFQALYLSN
jgi:hypothetical protein